MSVKSVNVSALIESLDLLKTQEEVRPMIQGVLTVHAIEANDVVLLDGQPPETVLGCYLRLSTRSFMKRTRLEPLEMVEEMGGSVSWAPKKGKVRWHGQLRHFPVYLVRNERHPFNMFQIDLMASLTNPLLHSEPHEVVLGSVSLHLHEISRAGELSSVFQVMNAHNVCANLHLQVLFNYGMFGYGHSPQLFQAEVLPEWQTRFSLFPRMAPPPSQTDMSTQTLMPRAVAHPASLVPFNAHAHLHIGRVIGPMLKTDDEFSDIKHRMQQLSHKCGSYNKLRKNRTKKIAFLQRELLAHHESVHDEMVPTDGVQPRSRDRDHSEHADALQDINLDFSRPTINFANPKVYRSADGGKIDDSNMFHLHAMLQQQLSQMAEHYTDMGLNEGQQAQAPSEIGSNIRQYRRQHPETEPHVDEAEPAASTALPLGRENSRRSSVIDEVLHGTDARSIRRGSVTLAAPELPPPPKENLRRSSVIELVNKAEQRRRASLSMMDPQSAAQQAGAVQMSQTTPPRG